LRKDTQNKILYRKLVDYVPKKVLSNKNRNRSWLYGYNEDHDLVVISRTGAIGDIVMIEGVAIALPEEPDECFQRHKSKPEQYWEREPLPVALSKIQSIFQWNEMPSQFKNGWLDYIDRQFNFREQGFWFMNNGVKTYITGAHWFYLQWASIDMGYPDFREANRILFIFWEACKADHRCFGMVYLKIRRRQEDVHR